MKSVIEKISETRKLILKIAKNDKNIEHKRIETHKNLFHHKMLLPSNLLKGISENNNIKELISMNFWKKIGLKSNKSIEIKISKAWDNTPIIEIQPLSLLVMFEYSLPNLLMLFCPILIKPVIGKTKEPADKIEERRLIMK